MYSLIYLFINNKDAILALPTEIKTIMLITFVLMFGGAIIGKAKKLLKFTIIAAIIYFVAAYFGLL
jgi:hypothetical protein